MKAKLAARLYLLLVLLAAGYAGLRWHGGTPVETDLLALLPVTERHPLAQQAVGVVSRLVGERSVFLVSAGEFEQAAAAARLLAEILGEDRDAFSTVLVAAPAVDARLPLRVHLPHRGHLLAPEDARALARSPQATLEARLAERLHAPPAVGPRTSIEEDPFGFLQRYLARLPLGVGALSVREGFFHAQFEGRSHILVFAEPAGSPYESGVQTAVARVSVQARQTLREQFPEVEVQFTGAAHHAAAARAQAEGEMSRIGGSTLAGILLLLLVVFRSPRHLWVGLLPIAAGLIVATAFCFAFYERLHLLTLGCGATLIGVAVDYAMHFFAVQLGDGPHWQSQAGMRRMLPALGLGVLTTLAGYTLLLAMPFPGLRQMALFSAVGIIVAAGAVWAWFPLLLQQPLRATTAGALGLPAFLLQVCEKHLSARRILAAAALSILLALPGWRALDSNDDIRLLIAPVPALQQAEARLRAIAGWGGGGQFYLVEGDDPAQLAQREQALRSALQPLLESGQLTAVNTLASFVPPLEQQRQDHALLERVWRDGSATRALEAAGFTASAIAGAYAAVLQSAPLTREHWLATPLGAAQRQLVLSEQAVLVLPQGQRAVAPLREAARELSGVSLIDQAGSVSQLFRNYREVTAWALLGAFPLAVAMLAGRYGWRAVVVVAPVGTAILLTLAILGWLGEPLTLFHLLGLFLVFGVGLDYSIFLHEDRTRSPAVVLGVLLAALTTLLSFGLLARSSMPALHGFGLTLFLGVLLAALAAPAVLVLPRSEAGLGR
ncbi:MAG: MMPL family transporter [Betaproteobacteria bacterium]|nr:MMPL family transporter [Betaproteobacteria bacterium]